MNGEYKELVDFLGGKFEKIDKRFDETDKKLLLVSGRLSNIEEIMGNLEEKKADKSDVDNLLNAIDVYAKKADTYFQEMVVMSHKMERLEKWLHQVADKVGIKLEY